MTCLHEQMVANCESALRLCRRWNCASALHLCRRWNCASALHLCRRWNGGTTHHWVYSTRLRTWSSLPASLLARCCVRGMCTRDTGSRPEITFCSRLTWYSCTARSTSSELTTGVVHSLWLAVPSLLWHCWLDVGRSMRPVKKIEWWGVFAVICLKRGADCLYMVQLMPLHPKTPQSLASFKSGLVLPLWYRLTEVVLEKRPLNGCSSSRSSSCSDVVYRMTCFIREHFPEERDLVLFCLFTANTHLWTYQLTCGSDLCYCRVSWCVSVTRQ